MKIRLFWLGIALCFPSVLLASPNFTREGQLKISSATPYAIDLNSSPNRLYFSRTAYEIWSATGSDQATWHEESGIRVSTGTTPLIAGGSFTITGASILKLDAGGFRMLYSIQVSSSDYRIVQATSSDGLGWANQPGTVFQSITGFIGRPQMIELPGGNWRLYFFRDSNGGDDLVDRTVLTALSTDQGATWGSASLALNTYGSDLAVAVRSDNVPRLYLTRPASGETLASTVVSALGDSSNGTGFALESGVRFSSDATKGEIQSLVVFKSSDTTRWRMLFGFRLLGDSVGHAFGAVTLAPDPQSMSPREIVRSAPASTFQINGEVFDSTPTVTLTLGSDSIPGTNVVRQNDRTLTATFDTENRAVGNWNLVATNSDGQSTTLSNALLITFLSGNVVLTDNLLRPRTGARTKIDVSVFADGMIEVNIYTLDGELVRSLLHSNVSQGSVTIYWDGRNGEGELVASGVYFVKATGPKLDERKKIVVIR